MVAKRLAGLRGIAAGDLPRLTAPDDKRFLPDVNWNFTLLSQFLSDNDVVSDTLLVVLMMDVGTLNI